MSCLQNNMNMQDISKTYVLINKHGTIIVKNK